MPPSTHWSSRSAACRPPIDAFGGRLPWRPSRWVIGAQLLLALLAPCAVLGSEMPRLAAWPLALAACVHGLWLARREAGKPARQVVWPATDAPVTLDGAALEQAELHWRGPLLFLHWRDRDGRDGRLGWWPDTLPSPSRRELRLAARARAAARPTPSMAP